MSYRIQYSHEFAKHYPIKKNRKRGLLPFAIIMVALLVAYLVFGTGIADIFLPGDQDVAASAFSGLVESVESGNSIRNALLDLCREIIKSGAYDAVNG